jgi:hypothetical protein
MRINWQEWPEHSIPGRTAYRAFVPAMEVDGLKGWYDIAITPRPPYCDRGAFLVHIQTQNIWPLDCCEGWPRYYFGLLLMFEELEAWVNARESCQRARKAGYLDIHETQH